MASTSSPVRNHYAVKVAPRSFSSPAPLCHRCEKSVFAVEKVIGPGSKTYHKTCLKCLECGKRLDPGALLDHEGEPFCKPCHGKLFGPKGYGYGGSMGGDYTDRYSPSPSRSPSVVSPGLKTSAEILAEANAALSSPIRRYGGSSPIKGEGSPLKTDASPTKSLTAPSLGPSRSLSGGAGALRRPDSPSGMSDALSTSAGPPRLPTFSALKGPSGDMDRCRRCGERVYAAEEIRAAGQRWHKRCLRCASCNKTLDSHLVVSEDLPYCKKCHSEKGGIAEQGFVLRPSMY